MVKLKLRERKERHSCSKHLERTSLSLSFSRWASGRITSAFSRLDPRPLCPLLLLLLLRLFFPWPASLRQQALEELAVLVEMVDGIVVVGARALHEIVKVSRRVLLGLSARIIRCGDRARSWPVGGDSFCSFSPLHGGALVLILALGLAFALASVGVRRGWRLLEVLYKGPWS